jgi:RNA polymerase sigma-70 factor (ECF subfamily)
MSPSDEALILQSLTVRDDAAFAELVRRHQARVLLLQRRLCRDAALAEDLTQETFIRAWQKLHTYRGTGSFAGWLSTLGYHIFLQHRRRHRREDGDTALPEWQELPDPAARGAEDALAELDRLLAILSEEDQMLLVLNYACGLTNQEIGDLLGMPTGTVKARIHRAKMAIHENLTGAAAAPVPEPPTTTGARARHARSPGVVRFFTQLAGTYRT